MSVIPPENPLSYLGKEPVRKDYKFKRDPTPSDFSAYEIGDGWTNFATKTVFKLVSKAEGKSEWAICATSAENQPRFFGALPATQSNVTGDGTPYLLGSGAGSLIVTQIGTAMSTDGTFTAPIEGFYQFNTSITFLSIVAGMQRGSLFFLKNSVIDGFPGMYFNAGVQQTSGAFIATASTSLFLEKEDTIRIQATVFGGTKVVDIQGSTTLFQDQSYFSGHFVGR